MRKTWCPTVSAAGIVPALWGILSGCSDAKLYGAEGEKGKPNDATAPVSKKTASDAPPIALGQDKDKHEIAIPPGPPAAETHPAEAVFPLKLSQRLATVDLPATVEDALVGGGGRFLILDLRSLQKLAVFDVSEGKIAGYVSLEGPKDLFAADADRLMVVDPQSRTAKRYWLAGLKQEAAQPIPGEVPIMAVGMGAASRGPMLVACHDSVHNQFFALDPGTFQLSEYTVTSHQGPHFVLSEKMRLSVSADGSAVGGWSDQHQPSGILVASLRGDQMECSYQHVSGGYVCPDDRGERVYSGRGLFDRHGEPIRDDDPACQKGVLAVPAIGGPYYLTVPYNERFSTGPRRTGHKKTAASSSESPPAAEPAVLVYPVGQSKPVATLPLEDFQLPKTLRRLFPIPAAQVIVEVPEQRDAVVLHHLDVGEQLKQSGVGELRVVSHPPTSVRVGETLSYQIQTTSKSGKPTYKLDAGPEGMVLSESGLLQWTPTSRPPSGKASAVISITDSGQTQPYAIVLAVQPSEGRPAPSEAGPTASTGPAPGDAPAADVRVRLPATYNDVCVGGGGQFLVFSLDSLEKLAVFDVFSAKIVGYVPLDGKCFYAAGADKLVVIDPEKLTVRRFDLATQKLETTRPLPAQGPVLFVAMGSASQGPVLVGVGNHPLGAQLVLLNLDTLEPLACEIQPQQRPGATGRVRASAGGRVFASGSPGGLELLVFDGRRLTQVYEFTTAGWVVPNDTGERIYTTRGIYTNQLKRLEPSTSNTLDSATLPAVHGPLFLRVAGDSPLSRRQSRGDTSAGVYLTDEAQPFATLRDLPIPPARYSDEYTHVGVTLDKRIYLVPRGNVIAMLPEQQDSVVLRRFDVGEELQRSGQEYLVVLSVPPPSVAVGQTYQYQLVAKSKSGKVRYRLDSGPEGMTLSDRGLLLWDVKTQPPDGSAGAIIISVSDEAGRTAMHSFAVAVKPGGQTSSIAAPATAPPSEPSHPTQASQEASPAPRVKLPSTGDHAENPLTRPGAQEVTCKLPATFDRVCLAKSGQVLVFRIPSLNKLAIFDFRAAKIVGYLPTGGDDVLFAGGAEKLILIQPEKMTVQRYRLDNLQLERSVPLDVPGKVAAAAMGAASSGPLLLCARGQVQWQPVLFDVDSLKPQGYNLDRAMPFLQGDVRSRASADGRVFTLWNRGYSPSGVHILTIVGDRVQTAYAHESAGYLSPDEQGERIYSMAGIYTPQAKRTGNDVRQWGTCLVPAVHGPFYLRIAADSPIPNPKISSTLTVHLAGETAPLAALPDVARRLAVEWLPSTVPTLDMDQRVYLVPDGQVLAVLPETADSIVLRRFDIDEELKRSGIDYLLVISQPPRSIRPGQTFEYQLDVRSKAGKVECRLDSGPAGMLVSKSGLVRWPVKNPPKEKTASVVISVADGSGKSVLHSFVLAIGEGLHLPLTVPAPVSGGSPPKLTPSGSPVEWQLTKVDDHRLKMPAGDAVLSPGLGYQSMLLLQGDHLAVLGADGMTIRKIHKLGATYKRIAERAEYFVAITGNPPAIDLLDKKTLDKIRRIDCTLGNPVDLAIHPTKPTSYVTLLKTGQQTNGSFVMVDEAGGKLRESKDYLGQWIAADADGQRLVTAGCFSRLAGSELLIVPHRGPGRPAPSPPVPAVPRPRPGMPPGARPGPYQPPRSGSAVDLRVLPRYQAIDAILVYELRDDGVPRPWDFAVSSPAGLCGLRMAPDGMHAACLRTGHNAEALDLDQLNEKPVQYADASGPAFAYHPALSLVACVESSGPIVFQRESGARQPGSLQIPPADLLQARIHHLGFSADGRGLILDMDAASGGHYLYRAELSVPPADLDKVRRRLANMASLGRDLLADDAPEPGKGSVPLAEIDALGGDRGHAMSAKEIGHLFTDSVVIVETGGSSGTGFVVGKTGYLLTCAHCVRQADSVSASYRSRSGNQVTMKSVPAKVLSVDKRKDLALLKIEIAQQLPAVRLGIGDDVESGERVTIIGNPGLGRMILDYTMTEGIVSNARRQPGHQTLVQTSAAVNPGCSGAPMFDSNGLVIGLVVLKGEIESAGFAVPAAEIGAFLAAAVKGTGPESAIQRQWLSSGGSHQITAQYLGLRDGAVQLQRADGTKIAVPLAKLSPQDQAFVRLLQPGPANQ